jgi:hypothetical protein
VAIRSERTIYQLVETHLRKQDSPITCVDLMDIPEIRKEAVAEFGGPDKDVRVATNKLSDTLGFMWRRGLLTRYPAPQSERSLARFAYAWASTKSEPSTRPIPPPVRSVGKSAINIKEHEEGVEIEFDKFIIYIKPK